VTTLAVDHDRAPEKWISSLRRSIFPEPDHGLLGLHAKALRLEDEGLIPNRGKSMDAMRAFAGSDLGKAVVEPGAEAALVDYDDRVEHYEVIEMV
jgi:hypothetical protein